MTPACKTACNADLDHPCDAGGDGEPCPQCLAYQAEGMAEASREWPAEVRRRAYIQDMRDAGRGHLLTPQERDYHSHLEED
jgi:hypothetical protein